MADLDTIFTPDDEREQRNGFAEVIYGAGKTPEQAALIAGRILQTSEYVLATRVNQQHYDEMREVAPDAVWLPTCRLILVDRRSDGLNLQDLPDDEGSRIKQLLEGGTGQTVVACAGTSDLPVAWEAAITARIMGSAVSLITDVGVAGLHRILARKDDLYAARAIAVVAGMEGALPSVIGGLVDVPIVAVPTSVGYGASFSGLAALLGMLNSCAGGVSVVNIDNGFGAGVILDRINRPPERFGQAKG